MRLMLLLLLLLFDKETRVLKVELLKFLKLEETQKGEEKEKKRLCHHHHCLWPSSVFSDVGNQLTDADIY